MAPYLILLLLGAGFAYSTWRVAQHAGYVHGQFDVLTARAKAARTRQELEACKEELSKLYLKHCYHRRLGDRARTLLAYLNGRLDALP